ncbi:hypothetical protein AVEN_262219-1 [Araneus ventricosus]|uniref:Uncharacterized protein n=1 Tax=Araneus ventricosus TaxID=182803 RepID=A0A4Y2UVA1_ARAVE|nr:hypothetical protein AVEN_170589-1 [Araneus ventricosus]GBO15470.1 hypothetical protein AVEN_262219-1 [Araneus ventricosus]
MAKLVLLVCCNPFQLPKHCVRKSLRPVQPWMVELKPHTIHPKANICVGCRKQLGKLKDDAPREKPGYIPMEAKGAISREQLVAQLAVKLAAPPVAEVS